MRYVIRDIEGAHQCTAAQPGAAGLSASSGTGGIGPCWPILDMDAERLLKLQGTHGNHDVFVLPPLGISFRALQERMPGEVFDKAIVTAALQQSLPSLDFLHSDANLTHTGHT